MNKNPNNLSVKAQAGFSLVDIMVGMVISLLGVIIIFQVFSVSESIKRTTTSGGEALQNGATALFSLERSLKETGYGIFSSTNIAPLPTDPLGTAPLVILAGVGAGGSDNIVLRYRQGWDFGPFPPDPTVFTAAIPPPLTVETITVNNTAQLVSDVNGVISDGIVLLKAEYGTDLNGNGIVDANEWSQAAPGNVWSVLAVRLAVVARSAQPEKPSGGGTTCDTTVIGSGAYPAWIDSAVVPLDISASLNLDVGAGDDWKCYRYKTFENTVPLRNVMWRP